VESGFYIQKVVLIVNSVEIFGLLLIGLMMDWR